MNEKDLFSVVYTGSSGKVALELERLADLVGVDFMRGKVPAVLTFDDAPDDGVVAYFNDMFAPYFPRGRVRLRVSEDSADILELMAAVGATLRGRVIGVVGAHGGAGTTTIAAWLARQLARGSSAGLIDANPASVGIDHVIAMDAATGKRWADLAGDGAILAGRLATALPIWHNVYVVSADERGGIPNAALAVQVISALSQTQPWTIVDFAPTALVPQQAGDAGSAQPEGIIEWCDRLVLVTRSDAVSLAHARVRAKQVPGAVVAGVGMRSKAEAAHAAEIIGVDHVFPVRPMRAVRGDTDHGIAPGDRPRSTGEKDIREIRRHLQESVA